MSKSSYINNDVDFDSASSVKDYLLLMKPRVMALVVFTAFCGLYLAPGNIHPLIAFSAILFITMGAGSSAAINMWYDRDIDKIMKRTQNRPLASGVIEADDALAFGIITGIISVILMALCINIISAALLAFTILYYVFVYTMWLKRTSIQNVVIGGVSGALPPVIGWAAVTGDISLESFSLFFIIFMWTPPHSWALALFRVDDYRNCSVPMMPVIKGELYTKKQILFYTILMIPITWVPYFLGMVNIGYFLMSCLVNLGFIYYTTLVFLRDTESSSKKLFFYSILHLFIIFFSLLVFKS